VTTRCETTINNDWGSGSPAGAGVGPDQFSVRWSTKFEAALPGTYNFTVTSDDGIRLYVDGLLVINQWRDQSPTTYTASRTLREGTHDFRIEYYENGGGAVARFSYTVATTSDVPDIALVVANPASPTPADVALRDRLVNKGFEVDYVDDDTFAEAAAGPYEAVWISGRTSNGAMGTRLQSLTKPIVTHKAFNYSNLKLATAASAPAGTTVDVVDASHPLAAGLAAGPVTVLSTADSLGAGTPAASAAIVATTASGSAVFAYLPGAAMVDGFVAPACRVALPYEFNATTILTADGWSFVDAAADWVLGPDCAG
jgi:hypothetical protein